MNCKSILALGLSALIAMNMTISRAGADDATGSLDEAGMRVFTKVDPSVVAIMHERAGGSGVIIGADGYILTNGHVVNSGTSEEPKRVAEKITVIMHDETKYAAKVIGHSLDPDVALIKIDPKAPLTPAPVGDSNLVRTGQRVFAVGMPTGLKRTLTGGVLSNVERTDLGTYTKVLQTDAAINPGNSGGPLFNERGEVLGLNTYGGGGQNLGFTIPSNVAMVMQEHYRKHGYFRRATLPFIIMKECYDELSQALGVPGGVMIDYVEPGSAAEKAGLASGDVIAALDGKPVVARTRAALKDFNWNFVTREVGATIALKVLRRDGASWKEHAVNATLVEDEPAPAYGLQSGEIPEQRYDGLGLGFMRVVTLARVVHELPAVSGAWVTAVGAASAAEKAGLQEDDLITEVEGVATPDDAALRVQIERHLAARKKAILLKVRRGNTALDTALAPDYDLKNKRIAVIAPECDHEHLALIRRSLLVDGADFTVYTSLGESRPVTTEEGSITPKSFVDAVNEKFDGMLLVGGEGAKALWKDAALAEMLTRQRTNKAIIGALGASVVTVALADPELAKKKMTAGEDLAADIAKAGGTYTGKPAETDGQLVTGTGKDRDAVREFLKSFRNEMRKNP